MRVKPPPRTASHGDVEPVGDLLALPFRHQCLGSGNRRAPEPTAVEGSWPAVGRRTTKGELSFRSEVRGPMQHPSVGERGDRNLPLLRCLKTFGGGTPLDLGRVGGRRHRRRANVLASVVVQHGGAHVADIGPATPVGRSVHIGRRQADTHVMQVVGGRNLRHCYPGQCDNRMGERTRGVDRAQFWRLGPSTSSTVFGPGLTREHEVHGSTAPWIAFVQHGADRAISLVLVQHPDLVLPWFVRAEEWFGAGPALAWDTPRHLAHGQTLTTGLAGIAVDGALDADAAATLAERAWD